MKIPSMNLDFGPVNGNVRLSPYGIAVTKDGEHWLTYDAANGKSVDVSGFTFDFQGMIYKTPVALNAVQEGDVILHNQKPMYIIEVSDTVIDAIDILDAECKTVLPITNMFGFNFVTKITPLMDMGGLTPSADNPFGNIMPMLLMEQVFGNGGKNFLSGGDGDSDFSKLMIMSAIFGGGKNPFGNIFNFGTKE